MQPETLFPISLNLKNRRCLVLGGGPVAETKIAALHDAGAVIQRVTDRLEPPHLDGVTLAVDSGEAPHLSPLLRTWTAERGILLNSVDRPEACDFHMPAVVRRGPVQVAISTGGAAPTLARNLRQLIERLLPPHLERLVNRAAAIRPQVKALFSPVEQRRFWNRMFDDLSAPCPDLPNGRLTEAEVSAIRSNEQTGEAWLVGAGAGRADLITLRGLKALERADVVLYDALIDPELLKHARRDARLMPVGKRCGKHSTSQDFINRTLVNLTLSGKKVVRLKCGDPFIFGRGGEELEFLAEAGIKAHVVPGVTAASVAAAENGIALTHRGISRRLTLMTATTNEGLKPDRPDWPTLLADSTVVLYMARNKLMQVRADMLASGIRAGLPVTIVANAGLPGGSTVSSTLGAVAEVDMTGMDTVPTLILFGETARPAAAEAGDYGLGEAVLSRITS